MADFADDAVDRDLNSMFDYDEYEDDEIYGIRRRRRRVTNQEIFAGFTIDKPIDTSQF